MTANPAPATTPAQLGFQPRPGALLSIAAAWVSPGIIAAGYAFGAPMTPTLLRRRCLYLASTPQGRRSQ